MATKFLEPGGDADFGVGLWDAIVNAPSAATDFVHGAHQRSLKFRVNVNDEVDCLNDAVDAGGRISVYLYFNALPNATATILSITQSTLSQNVFRLRMTSAGILQFFNDTVQIGSNGSTLATGIWYRLSLAWTLTSTSVNSIKLFKNGTIDITVTNATLNRVTSNSIRLGNISTNLTQDMRASDFYVDDSSALTDTGDIWVTAKRPFANGTANNFVTQIGAGGSGYGSGHSPQVNERPLSTTNGWSVVAVGSAVTEEYTIEVAGQGDIPIGGARLIDFMGWISAKTLSAETGSFILANNNTNVSLTTTITIFKVIAGSTTYPAGNTDIGLITSTTVTTVSLYECGIVFAFIPNTDPILPITQPSNHYFPDVVSV